MIVRNKLGLIMFVGIGIGAAAVQILHAQVKSPVYMIAMNELTNPDGFKTYLPEAQAAIKRYGGVYVAAGAGTMIDGAFPNARVVILRWETMDALEKWRHSAEYRAGKAYAHYNVVAVDGVNQ